MVAIALAMERVVDGNGRMRVLAELPRQPASLSILWRIQFGYLRFLVRSLAIVRGF
jgi:hypothetical protein